MRILPGKLALWVHALVQVISLAVYIAAVGLGIYLVTIVQIPFGGGNLVSLFCLIHHRKNLGAANDKNKKPLTDRNSSQTKQRAITP